MIENMMKNKTLEKLMRWLITLLGAGAGAAVGALIVPLVMRWQPQLPVYTPVAAYIGLCVIGAALGYGLSGMAISRTMRLMTALENRWETMPAQQILFTSLGMVIGLAVAALLNQLVLSAGPSLLTISFSALMYLVLGYLGMRVGYRRGRDGKLLGRMLSRLRREDAEEAPAVSAAAKLLDTSVIIDGRILDIAKTGFLEGEIIVPQFVLAELRHIADSGDSMRRARGRRGLDVLQKLQKEIAVTVLETDYPDVTEVDVKLLRLCRDTGGTVVTNDYNLNKVAGVTGIRVLNVNDLANAVKPMLMAGEEMNVQIVREGKEPGQGVAYLDDGTMIVVENARRFVGETVTAVVTTVLQTSAGRMIFTKLKTMDEKVGA